MGCVFADADISLTGDATEAGVFDGAEWGRLLPDFDYLIQTLHRSLHQRGHRHGAEGGDGYAAALGAGVAGVGPQPDQLADLPGWFMVQGVRK